MQTTSLRNPQTNYDPRWFIWTIVFLVTTGIMLVTYIVVSDNGNDVSGLLSAKAASHKVIKK